ncbi:receptor-transporting protein 4 [Capricornis sumatraensis]|uniref:receptor-transporting protein 4 n=1 Tax=Capricornis sumatraensis TaxID=34865 RepID=UPI0036045BB8
MDTKPQSKRIALDIKEWEQTFQELICQEKPRARWTLKMDGNLRPNCVAQGWRQYQQRGFGRFQCSSCRRSWASAQVQILCHMYLESQKSTGKVLVRIFGQRCKKCFQSQFEKPDFSPESSQRILKNLVQRVLEKFYRNGIRKVSEIPVKPEVPLDGSHDKANCEACILGYCGLNLENCMTGPGKSSLCYMNTGNSSPHNGDECGQNRSRNHSAAGSGYSETLIGSGPSHVTAGIQVPGTGPQPKREMGQLFTPGGDRQVARATGPQPIQVARSLPPGWTDPWPNQAVGPLPAGDAYSQSTLRRGPQAPRMTYSQAIRMSGQRSTQDAQATQGAQLQATKTTEPQPTRGTMPRATSRSDSQAKARAGPPPQGSSSQPVQGAISKATTGSDIEATGKAGPLPQGSSSQPTREANPKATSGSDSEATGKAGPPAQGSSSQPAQEAIPKATVGSDTEATRRAGPPVGSSAQPTWPHVGPSCGSQAAWGREERWSPGGSASNSFYRLPPSNDFRNQEQLFRWGYACVFALFTFLVSKYL